MHEIEVKARIQSADEALQILQKVGFQFGKPVHQSDSIFARTPAEIVAPYPGLVVVRIRQEGVRATLNLKQHRTNELDCLELETGVTEPAHASRIIEMLGLLPAVTVQKTRHQGRQNELTVCVDSVQGLGNFVELERLYRDEPPPNAQEVLFVHLCDLLAGIELQRVVAGYDRLLLEAAESSGR